MIFFNNQKDEEIKNYIQLLKIMGSLSNLFSENTAPYLNYRVMENVFCRAFFAENLSRSDVSADALKDQIGIGLKTFLHDNGKTFQKIAEFNKESPNFKGLTDKELVEKFSNMRNDRLNFTKRLHKMNDLMYHLLTREKGFFNIFEEDMNLVDINNIKDISRKKNTIYFHDNIAEYNINLSKSTLLKRFITEKKIKEIPISILEDPYEFLLSNRAIFLTESVQKQEEFVYLPLYSYSKDKGYYVPERSGLNQWNANGRERKKYEVYIPIPITIHRNFPDFFPGRDEPFSLQLPSGDIMSAKLCQTASNKKGEEKWGKALMSNPNSKLGEWILKDVLNLGNGELITYELLENLNIDSVVIHKKSSHEFSINFSKIGSFQNFSQNHIDG